MLTYTVPALLAETASGIGTLGLGPFLVVGAVVGLALFIILRGSKKAR